MAVFFLRPMSLGASLTGNLKMHRAILTVLLVVYQMAALAVGFNDDDPPTPTETTKTCTDGQIWDEKTKACVDPDKSSLNDRDRMNAVRELAYAGRLSDAERVLDAVSDQEGDAVMTYRGYIARNLGRTDEAYDWYGRALAANPDNLLARSYLGQWHVESGNIDLARAELSEIRQRGGRSTWPEISLRLAIQSGTGYSY